MAAMDNVKREVIISEANQKPDQLIEKEKKKKSNIRRRKKETNQTERNIISHHFPFSYHYNQHEKTSAASHFHLKTNQFFLLPFLLPPPHPVSPPFHHFLEERGATKPYPSDTMEYKRQDIHATLLSKARREQTMNRIHFFIPLLKMTIQFFPPFQFGANIRKIRKKYHLTGLVLHWFRNVFWRSPCR